MDKTSVLIADDHTLFRKRIRFWEKPGF